MPDLAASSPDARLWPVVVVVLLLNEYVLQPEACIAARGRLDWRNLFWRSLHNILVFAVFYAVSGSVFAAALFVVSHVIFDGPIATWLLKHGPTMTVGGTMNDVEHYSMPPQIQQLQLALSAANEWLAHFSLHVCGWVATAYAIGWI